MNVSIKYFALFFLLLITLCNCSKKTLVEQTNDTRNPCYMVFDAGSSGTRMYVYEQVEDWLSEHKGPKIKIAALADPILEENGKNWDDVEEVIGAVTSGLDLITRPDPEAGTDKARWEPFDWNERCDLKLVGVFGTAGMRLAEQKNLNKAEKLWDMLATKLRTRVGGEVPLVTRTISGFEEGFFAWLAMREKVDSDTFGIVEMGGASSQIAFPCPDCDPNDDAVQEVLVDNKSLQLYSYSFLGLGRNKAFETLGFPETCKYGVGASEPNWKEADCADELPLVKENKIVDPYNMNGDSVGTARSIPKYQQNVTDWYLIGAFNDRKKNSVNKCCKRQGKCKKPEKSCFTSVYYKKYLNALQVPVSSKTKKARWAKGLVLCTLQDCMQNGPEPQCRWLSSGCLQ